MDQSQKTTAAAIQIAEIAAAGIVKLPSCRQNFLSRSRYAASNLEICREHSLPPIHIPITAAAAGPLRPACREKKGVEALYKKRMSAPLLRG